MTEENPGAVAAVTGRLDAGVTGRLDAGVTGRLDAGVTGRLDAGVTGRLDAGVTGRPRGGPGLRPGVLAGGLVAVTLWGLAPVATRTVVGHLAPVPLLVLRLGAASLVLLPWALPVFRRLTPRAAARLLAAGLLGLVGYNLPVTVGLQWLPASVTGLLLATEPIWVLVLGRVFLAERVTARAWLGSALALGGVAILAGPAALASADLGLVLAGAALVLAGTLAFAAYTIVLRPLGESYGPVAATAASTIVGTLPYLAFAATVSPSRLARLPGSAWVALAFLALGSTALGLLLWNRAILSGGTARVSMLLYLEPVVSVVGAMVFLGERGTALMVLGGLLILSGVAAAGIGRAPDRAGSRQQQRDPGGQF